MTVDLILGLAALVCFLVGAALVIVAVCQARDSDGDFDQPIDAKRVARERAAFKRGWDS